MWQLQTPIYINQAKQIFDALQVNNIKNSWLSTHFQKVQFLHKYRNLPLKKSFHIFFMWFSHTKDLFSFNRNWWNDNIFEGVFTYLILLLKEQGFFCTNVIWKLRKKLHKNINSPSENISSNWAEHYITEQVWCTCYFPILFGIPET